MNYYFKSYKQILPWLFMLVNTFNLVGQEKLYKILNESIEVFNQTASYDMVMVYSMYTNKGNDFKKTEEYSVDFSKANDVTKISVFGGDMYTYKDFLLTVFAKENKILIRDNSSKMLISSLEYLEAFELYYNIFIDFETKSEIVFKLLPKDNIDLKEGKVIYQKIKLKVSKIDNQLIEQQLFFNKGIDLNTIASDNVEMLSAMMQIAFSKIKKNNKNLPEFTHFVKKGPQGKLISTESFSGYIVEDERENIQTKQ